MRRKIFDSEGHAHFVTFSCYKRRMLLDDDRAKGIVVHFLADELARQEGTCLGFVVMPDHVHALLHFLHEGTLSRFMKQWKQRSSIRIKKFFGEEFTEYASKINLTEPVWQPGYHDFNVYSQEKANQKIEYMHTNPVKAGLSGCAEDWRFSSAGWYLCRKPVGVPIDFLS